MKSAPGPKGLSLLGNIFAMRGTDPLTFWLDAHARYGDTIKLKLGPMDVWFFASPTAIYDILVTRHRIMRKGIGYAGLRKLLGEGLIATDREHWASQRERLNPVFAPTSINAYSGSVYDACVAGLSELKSLASKGEPIDIGHTMTRLTMRIISLAAFGVDLTTGHDEIVDAFGFSFGFVADITAEPVHIPLFIPTRRNRKFRNSLAVINSFIDQLIDQSMSGPAVSGLHGNIFRALKGIDRALLRDEVINLYFAGFETTARTMTFLMHQLPQHPDVLDAVRAEAKTLGKPDEKTSIAQRLPYVTEVVNEALRLFPPVAMMARQSNVDCIIDDCHVGANSILIVCPFIAQRNPAFWPSGDTFAPSPDRPLGKRLLHRGAFTPFGAGPRICLGKHFAMAELAIAMAVISENFDWVIESPRDVQLDFHGTLRPGAPVHARLSLRNSTLNQPCRTK